MQQPGRDDVLRWRAQRLGNFFAAVPMFESAMRVRRGSRYTPECRERLDAFGRVVATVIEPAVSTVERHRDFPQLHSYDAVGQHVERIEFHPAHVDAARATWASGMVRTTLDEDGAFEAAGLFFLLSHVGEGGQACAVVCTIGLRRALAHRASRELAERFMGGLDDPNWDSALRGSQFLTEFHGGSDVGANVTRAVPDAEEPGAWRISGEKWFCSVADADLFAVTARTDGARPGTAGLTCFLVPRTIDGTTANGFSIRRLKDKLGTRGLASGEFDFNGALGWPIGSLSEGFDVTVTELLNTSRWLNAVGSTGIMSRAFLEASTYAHHRRAFAQPIESFATVREQLATMKLEVAGALASTMALTELVGRLDAGTATESEVALHRWLVNVNKFVTSSTASDVVHRAIEILGGNGTIEDFSALPRLYRDAVVYESWEGTHTVLCAQVRRDCARYGLVDVVATWLRTELSTVSPTMSASVSVVRRVLDELEEQLARTLTKPDNAHSRFREQLTLLLRVLQATCLLRAVDGPYSTPSDATLALAFVQLRVATSHSGDSADWLDVADDVLTGFPRAAGDSFG